jgi:hypothetical protein
MCRLLVIASLVLLTQAGMAQQVTQHKRTPMSDAAMDKVTAAGVSASFSGGVINFQGSVPTANGLVTGAGTLQVLSGPITSNNMGTISLSGGAQQDLSSLVNINAVNSNINVLLNLNVNINSTVGTLTQSNLNTGKH